MYVTIFRDWHLLTSLDAQKTSRLCSLELNTTIKQHLAQPGFLQFLYKNRISSRKVRQITREDLPLLPVMTKEDLKEVLQINKRENYRQQEVIHTVHTSGTTKKNGKTTVNYTSACVDQGFAHTAIRSLLMAGITPHICKGYFITPSFPDVEEPASHIKAMAVAKTVGQEKVIDQTIATPALEHIEQLAQHNPDYIMSAPNFLRFVMRQAKKAGITSLQEYAQEKRYPFNSKVIWYGGAPFLDVEVKEIEQFYSARCVGFYASTEGRIMGGQRFNHNGEYEIFTDKIHLEVVDKQGVPVKPGQRGDIVITPFYHATPLVRYKLGDSATLVAQDNNQTIIKDINRSGDIFIGDALISYAEIDNIAKRANEELPNEVGYIQLMKTVHPDNSFGLTLRVESKLDDQVLRTKLEELFYENYQIQVLTKLGTLPPIGIDVVAFGSLTKEGYKHKSYIERSAQIMHI